MFGNWQFNFVVTDLGGVFGWFIEASNAGDFQKASNAFKRAAAIKLSLVSSPPVTSFLCSYASSSFFSFSSFCSNYRRSQMFQLVVMGPSLT
jgi:hypothetical protein